MVSTDFVVLSALKRIHHESVAKSVVYGEFISLRDSFGDGG